MLQSPSISQAQFQSTIVVQSVSPILDEILFNVPLTFADVSNLRQFSGSYTPANDYLYIVNGLLAANAPTFILVLCDSQLDLTFTFSKSAMNIPVQRFGFYSWILDPLNFVSGLYIDGRTGPNPGNTPMPQGVAVNYTIILGQGVVS